MESVFALLNAGALAGWSTVLALLLLQSANSLDITPRTARFFDIGSDDAPNLSIINALLFLEAICFVEVGRIAVGQLKGNLVLGVWLHIIRMTCLLLVLPDGLSSAGAAAAGADRYNQYACCTMVLYSWSLTEVCRYPMYIFPTSSIARYIRLVLPIVTFPVGAAAEAFGAYTVLTQILNDGASGGGSASPALVHWGKVGLLGMVLFVNLLLGPTLAYPALLKKGLPVLMGKKSEGSRRTKRA